MNLKLFLLVSLSFQTNAFQPPTKYTLSTSPPKFSNIVLQSQTGEASEDITIEQYSRCLSPYEERQSIKREESQYSIVDARPHWQKVLGKLTRRYLSSSIRFFLLNT